MDVAAEIHRILNAETPHEVLRLEDKPVAELTDDVVTQAWKRLMLLLHPDKIARLVGVDPEAGADALNYVHKAREELRKTAQERGADVPAKPRQESAPRCLESMSGRRKYMISWRLPEAQDPARPIESYEVWGPKYFSEVGEPYDWVMLAAVPALQSQFVLVEEAPTQQDVMWAADRVLRPTLPITLHASNGRGQSEPLAFELPWATAFPWLRGVPSALCTSCFRLNPAMGPWIKCSGCSATVPSTSKISIRCPECQGTVLWEMAGRTLKCTCCMRQFGKDMQLIKPGGGAKWSMPSPRPHGAHQNQYRSPGLNRKAW